MAPPKPLRILVIAYFFPPDATGVRRLLAHLNTWLQEGAEVEVVTCRAKRGAGYDSSPLNLYPWLKELPVHATESLDPYRLLERLRPTPQGATQPTAGSTTKSTGLGPQVMELLRRTVFVPDDRRGWVSPALRKALELHRARPFHAVYTSNYPQSTHLVGYYLKRQTGLRWVADFRDGWTQNPVFHRPATSWLRRATARWEARVVQTADHVVTVSPPITRHLQTLRAPGQSPVRTIFNGYDPADFPPALAQEYRAPIHPGKLTLLYTGTLFGGRSAAPFFQLVGQLLRQFPQWKEKLRLQFHTALSPGDAEAARHAELPGEMLQVLPSVPFTECCRLQQRAEALLLILERGPGSEIMVSQKVFEYLAAGRPIYALIPRGAAEELLSATGGACVETNSTPTPEAVHRFHLFLQSVDSGGFPPASQSALLPFQRQTQAREILKLFV